MAREKFPSDDVDRMMVRFPAGLRDRLKAEAEANKRSMNAEIVGRLENSLNNSDFFEHPILSLEHRKHLDRSGLVIASAVIEEILAYFNTAIKDLPPHIAENVASINFMRNMVAHGPAQAEAMNKTKV